MPVKRYNDQIAQEIAEALLSSESLKIQPESPFTWASGWKSPVYCDNRLSLSFPEIRLKVKDSLVQMIKDKFPDVECIAGVATAGIPQGVLVADALGLPFIYVRSESKDHGLQNQIEGEVVKGRKVVLIEDLVSTGKSCLRAAAAVRNAGMEVLGMAAIFTYGFAVSEDNFSEQHVDLFYLSDYHTLTSKMMEDGRLDPGMKDTLQAWRSNPAQWGNEVEEY